VTGGAGLGPVASLVGSSPPTGSTLTSLATSVGLVGAPNAASLVGVPKASIWAFNPITNKFASTANFNPAAGSELFVEQSYLNSHPSTKSKVG
jgi:hypothetical protein